ncbi:rhamnogalacturonan lyase B N-terminal domain-containing protein [Pseudoduganella aquatica]|uniref:rhamnogalacturonan lyase B N-terminal domain-containing protein n=1 Tax=Pseudoduganella aquatica TaxID=2660641 RepID=UPI001E3C24DB|nr:rhamnogalacturonan lyase B N-terminal domain-containing protein [Pseudoduganella aquatica]
MNMLKHPAAGLAVLLLAAGCGGSDPVAEQGQAKSALRMGQAGPAALAEASSFGLTSDANFYTIDTGAGLVFKIRRLDNGVSTQSAGDIASMIYNGVQYQDQSRGSQVNSGFDYLYTGASAVSVNAEAVGSETIKVTVVAGNLTHYYIVQKGVNNIYMGTYFTSEPNTLNLARFILRVPIGALPNGPVPSDLRGTTTTVESGDVFGLPNGQTRSKHYSNMRLKDWQYIGATSATAGLWVVRDNNEGNSGGPFYRSLLNQATATNQELTYIVNYGEAQTEALRTNILNSYTLVFNDGSAPAAVDTSFFSGLGLTGYVGPAGRGRVAGVGITGRDPGYEYTVGFANATAQYWAKADAATGHFDSAGMLPGTYTMKVYKNEYAVDTRSVTVAAGGTVALNTIAIAGDPSAAAPLWRIGDWDGTPAEFVNGDKVTTMHPSDVRMASWTPADYQVGTSNAATGFPAYQWKDVNGTLTIRFNLTKSQIADYQLRLGITAAFAGGRPKPQINGWIPANPAASTQPSTRTLTVGTYRGNNTMYTFSVPASELQVGQNVLTLTAISGSSGVTYLSPGYAYDAVDMIKQ